MDFNVAHAFHVWIENIRHRIPPEVHPSGRAIVHEWLHEMHEAIHDGDFSLFLRRLVHLREKVAQELEWYVESLTTPQRVCGDFHLDRECAELLATARQWRATA
jgi:hypothetical protein